MKNNRNNILLQLKASKERITKLLLEYDYYDYEPFFTIINSNSNLIVLEYRSGFQNVYQSLTIVVTEVVEYCEVILYESKTTLSLSNLLNKKKEIDRIVQYIKDSQIKILSQTN